MLSYENPEQEIAKSKGAAMAVFMAEWCKPSLLQIEAFKKINERFDQNILFAVINVDNEAELTKKYQVKTLPTIILFAAAKEVERLIGFQSEEYLAEYAQALLKEVKSLQSAEQSEKTASEN